MRGADRLIRVEIRTGCFPIRRRLGKRFHSAKKMVDKKLSQTEREAITWDLSAIYQYHSRSLNPLDYVTRSPRATSEHQTIMREVMDPIWPFLPPFWCIVRRAKICH